jgi:hypothetical protein
VRERLARIRLTVPHSYDFGDDRASIGRNLVTPEGWDAARATVGPFGLPATRREWERLAEAGHALSRADDIATIARDLGTATLCSHGVGTAALELALHRRLPDVRLICTDFAPRAVNRLSDLFPEAEIVLHDLRVDNPTEADLHLMHRIDSELSTAEWKRVLPRYATPILLVPTTVLTYANAARELVFHVRRRRATRAGWSRNEAALRALWRSSHDDRAVTIVGEPAFLLTPKR